MMTDISISFRGRPGDENDKRAHKIAEQHGAQFLGGGTMLPEMIRDLQFDVPNANVEACRAALKAAGYKVDDSDD